MRNLNFRDVNLRVTSFFLACTRLPHGHSDVTFKIYISVIITLVSLSRAETPPSLYHESPGPAEPAQTARMDGTQPFTNSNR